MGEYIVCGEAVNDVGEVLQSTCFNVIIQRIDNTGESYFRRFSSSPVIWKHVGEPFLCHVEASTSIKSERYSYALLKRSDYDNSKTNLSSSPKWDHCDHHRGAGDRRWSRHFCNLA